MFDLNLTSILAQLPLVGIFVWFILERDKRQAAGEERRDSQHREFAAIQHERANEFMQRVADEIKLLAVEAAAHDARTLQAYQQVAELLARVGHE